MTGTISALGLAEPILLRAIAGVALAAIVAGGAVRVQALTRGGWLAAILCGTVCAAAGWKWAWLLVIYFIAAAVVSRARRNEKQHRIGDVVSKGAARDASQVLANGGVYVAAAVIAFVSSDSLYAWGALGALAASSADTWATEIGVLSGGRPTSIVSRTHVRPGESGGVTATGFAGALAGASLVAIAAVLLGFPLGAAVAAIIAGMAGCIIDSLLGVAIQDRRFCARCNVTTERFIHGCGAVTRHVGGIQWVDNDVVNALATFFGFCVSCTLYLIMAGILARAASG